MVIATVKEGIGDEIDALIEHIKAVEKAVDSSKARSDNEELRKRRIVVRNLWKREAEDIVDRVKNIIGYLRVRSKVIAAERKESKSSPKPGIAIAHLERRKRKSR